MLDITQIRDSIAGCHKVKNGYPFKAIVGGNDAFLPDFGFIEVDDIKEDAPREWTLIFHFHGVDDQFFKIDFSFDSWDNVYDWHNLVEVETYTEPVTKWREKK